MDTPSDRAPEPLAAWFAATQGGAAVAPSSPEGDPAAARERGGRVPRRLLVAAAVPWLVALALGAAAMSGAVPTPTAPAVDPVAAHTPPPATTHPPSPGVSAPADPPRTGAPVDPPLAAAAVLTLRLALPDDQYLDTAVAEQSDTVGGVAVVTVAAVVLDRVDGAWSGPRHVRFAVPFTVGQTEPVALAPPWVVPSSELSRAQPQATPLHDRALAAAAERALHAAGYRDLTAPQLRRHTALPDILAVHVTARAPGERTAREHEIWLDAAASRLLGAAAAGAPAPLPAPVPAEAP